MSDIEITVSVDPDPIEIVVDMAGGGGGAVDSVNGQTGAVVLHADDVGARDASTQVPAADVDVDTSTWVAAGSVPNPWDAQAALTGFDDLVIGQIVPALDALGTAANKDVPASGDAASGEVVLGSDSRLGAVVERIWQRDGAADLIDVPVNTGGARVDAPALSVVDGRLRVTGGGTVRARTALHVPGTEGWGDSEIRSIWWGSGLDLPSGQPGHVHRGSAAGGIVVDQNLIGPWSTTYAAVWEWDGAGYLTIQQNVSSDVETGVVLPTVTSVKYLKVWNAVVVEVADWGSLAATTSPKLTLSGTGTALDGLTFTGTVYRPNNGLGNNKTVAIIAALDTPLGADIPLTAAPYGAQLALVPITPGSSAARRMYPFWVASRVIGSKLQAKKWQVGMPEPSWSVGSGANWAAWEMDITVPIPSDGWCGLMANHIPDSGFLEFGDTLIRRLDQ